MLGDDQPGIVEPDTRAGETDSPDRMSDSAHSVALIE
jgi:hypothetical protein